MKRFYFLFIFLILALQTPFAQVKTVRLKVMHTTDIHGNYFPFSFTTLSECPGSLTRISALVKNERNTYRRNLLFLDNGDILQGQPSSYYYNYIDTTSTHLCATMMNEMGYDAGNLGNHDVETGMKVFSRWAKECKFPILCANAIVKATGQPYFLPFQIFVRDGVKVAVLGMLTSAIPCWLSEDIYPGLQFDDMEATARKWIKIIKDREKPDVIIGLFHSGIDAQTLSGKYRENASLEVAERVPGFDVILAGHDHMQYCKWVKNTEGHSVLVINPGKNGMSVSNVDITVVKKGDKLISKKVDGKLTSTDRTIVDERLMKIFAPQFNTLKEFVSHKLGVLDRDISITPAFYRSSSFIDAIHTLQLQLTGADISFTAPFSLKAVLKKGNFYVADLFSFYKYENKLYVMKLTGREIKNYLEESYGNWFNEMHSPDDHLLKLQIDKNRNQVYFKNPLFNFDSAAGIIYNVDVRKHKGEMIQIASMADGSPFYMDKVYQVVLNSYRGNGGGELLTAGAGIPLEKLSERIIYRSENELRFYMLKYIEKNGLSFFHPLKQWKLIPEDWTQAAAKRDSALLFDDPND